MHVAALFQYDSPDRPRFILAKYGNTGPDAIRLIEQQRLRYQIDAPARIFRVFVGELTHEITYPQLNYEVRPLRTDPGQQAENALASLQEAVRNPGLEALAADPPGAEAERTGYYSTYRLSTVPDDGVIDDIGEGPDDSPADSTI